MRSLAPAGCWTAWQATLMIQRLTLAGAALANRKSKIQARSRVNAWRRSKRTCLSAQTSLLPSRSLRSLASEPIDRFAPTPNRFLTLPREQNLWVNFDDSRDATVGFSKAWGGQKE